MTQVNQGGTSRKKEFNLKDMEAILKAVITIDGHLSLLDEWGYMELLSEAQDKMLREIGEAFSNLKDLGLLGEHTTLIGLLSTIGIGLEEYESKYRVSQIITMGTYTTISQGCDRPLIYLANNGQISYYAKNVANGYIKSLHSKGVDFSSRFEYKKPYNFPGSKNLQIKTSNAIFDAVIHGAWENIQALIDAGAQWRQNITLVENEVQKTVGVIEALNLSVPYLFSNYRDCVLEGIEYLQTIEDRAKIDECVEPVALSSKKVILVKPSKI